MKKIIFLFIGIIFSYSVFFQVKLEKYITEQKKRYGILENRKRISYIPASIYYIQSYIGHKDYNRKSTGLIMHENNLDEMIVVHGYNDYIMECYYNYEEKKEYLKVK